jgi:hypothetical protein
LPEPYTGALADHRHDMRHLAIAVAMWLVAVFLVAWLIVVSPWGAKRFLLLFVLLTVAVAMAGASVAVSLLRPRLISAWQGQRQLTAAADHDALGRPPIDVGDRNALTGEMRIETVDGRRRLRGPGCP